MSGCTITFFLTVFLFLICGNCKDDELESEYCNGGSDSANRLANCKYEEDKSAKFSDNWKRVGVDVIGRDRVGVRQRLIGVLLTIKIVEMNCIVIMI